MAIFSVIKKMLEKLLASNGGIINKKTLLFMMLIGISFIFLGNLFSLDNREDELKQINTDDMEVSVEDPTMIELEEMYEENLTHLLNNIAGISEVEVMINIDSTYIQIYEAEEIKRHQITDELDTSGGKRKVEDQTNEKIISYKRTNNEEIPIHVQTRKPIVRGILITAKGVDDVERKREIVDAVAKLFDIPTFRISIMAK